MDRTARGHRTIGHGLFNSGPTGFRSNVEAGCVCYIQKFCALCWRHGRDGYSANNSIIFTITRKTSIHCFLCRLLKRAKPDRAWAQERPRTSLSPISVNRQAILPSTNKHTHLLKPENVHFQGLFRPTPSCTDTAATPVQALDRSRQLSLTSPMPKRRNERRSVLTG